MIKTFHRLFFCKSDEEYKALDAYFRALGFAIGESWDGRRSKGIKFEAPESGVEIGMGEGFPDADLVIEVDNADVIYEVVTNRKIKVLEDIRDADWGARRAVAHGPVPQAGRLPPDHRAAAVTPC